MPTSRTSQPISPARAAAFAILLRVERQGSYASELLRGELLRGLDSRDTGLCNELVLGSLRWQSQLDFATDHFLSGRAGKIDGEVRVALRLGAYQLLHLSRIPARAAIAESVELVKQSPRRFAAGLVNAVLRRVSEAAAGGLASLRPGQMSAEEWDAVTVAHPLWMLRRWAGELGWSAALARAASHNQLPALYVRGTGSLDLDALRAALQEEEIRFSPTLLRSCLRVLEGDVARTGLFARGELAVQDLASQMVPLLLDVQPGQRVLDLCAAPGNKAALLALAAGRQGMVVACDLHARRLRRWSPRTSGGNAAPIHRLALDGTQPLPLRGMFDRVLVDAPCSGTGTLRRNPEIKWRLRLENIRELSELQLALLRNAAAALAPGGRIVYSTCSYEPEENQQVVARFLEEHTAFRLTPLAEEAARLRPHLTAPDDAATKLLLQNRFLTTSPEAHHCEGFFAAILQCAGK